MSGKELFEALVQNTGLPEAYVRGRFEELILTKGITLDNLTIEHVRELLADLLQDLIQQSNPELI